MCRAFGALPHRPDVSAENVHVPDLAAGALLFAVEVHMDIGQPAEQVVNALIHAHRRRRVRAEHVGHHRHRCDRAGEAEWVVQHGPQVLFELTGDRAVHGPVSGVVRPHGQLVDHQCAIEGLEKFDGEHTNDAQLISDPQRQLLGGSSQLIGQPGRGRQHGDADALALNGFHDRPGCALSQWRARHQSREFTAHRHPFL